MPAWVLRDRAGGPVATILSESRGAAAAVGNEFFSREGFGGRVEDVTPGPSMAEPLVGVSESGDSGAIAGIDHDGEASLIESFKAMGLSESAARSAAAGRDAPLTSRDEMSGLELVAAMEGRRLKARPTPAHATGTREVSLREPATAAQQLEAGFRRMGLTAAAAKEAARDR